MSIILHNATVDTLLERRSIRKFKPKPLSDDIVETLETVGPACRKQPIPERLVGNPHHRSGRKEASCRNRRAAIYRDRATAVRVCA